MKTAILILLGLLTTLTSRGQSPESLSNAQTFEHIIAMGEKQEGRWVSYYLTKSGRIFGKDSLHIFDNSYDCESEGFIRFTDRKTGKVGMFNRHGEVVVPAAYDFLTRVQNGLITGLIDGEKEYWHPEDSTTCNHYSWKGGTEVLIDTANHVLTKSFAYTPSLNFFSLERSASLHTDSIRTSFPATDGTYLSFIDFEKEFTHWLFNELPDALTPEKLSEVSYHTITWWDKGKGWIKTDKQKYIERNFDLLQTKLLQAGMPGCEYMVSVDGLNSFIYEEPEFEKYFDHCGSAKMGKYPVMSLVISHSTKKGLLQDHFDFLRTDEGYRLISLTIRSQ